MLFTFSNTSQTVVTDQLLNFNNNTIQTGCTATHAAGSSSISLNKPGYYMVSFNADGVESGTAGNITVQLNGNGTAIQGAEATANSAAVADVVNLKFTALVQVMPNCCGNQTNTPYTLTFANTGVGAIFTNAAVSVTKIC